MPLNDLTVVNGNLILAGTLNVSVSSGGAFDPGLYRVISYNGTLTDNGWWSVACRWAAAR
jgi:fibronectin-binding autotransporter adhesin